MSDEKPIKPPAPPYVRPVTIGTLARDLRFAAGITRRDFGNAVKISEPMVMMFETNRRILSPEQLQRVMDHPAMAALPRLAIAAGLLPDPNKPN